MKSNISKLIKATAEKLGVSVKFLRQKWEKTPKNKRQSARLEMEAVTK